MASSSYTPRFQITTTTTPSAAESAYRDFIIDIGSRLDGLETVTDGVASSRSSSLLLDRFHRGQAAYLAGMPVTRGFDSVQAFLVTATATAQNMPVATSRRVRGALTPPPSVKAASGRLGFGSAELAFDIGVVVLWVMFGLMWLKMANMRRDGRLQWPMSLLGWMERTVQEGLKGVFEKCSQIFRSVWTNGAVCVKWGLPVAIIWAGYRAVRFFGKKWWERDNSVDHHVALGLHLLSGLFIAVGPIRLLVALFNWVIWHDDAVEVCDLCGDTSFCQHSYNANGQILCGRDPWDQGHRTPHGLRTGWERHRNEALGERYDLQTVSTLPSGQRFSPVPWALRPPRLTAFDRLCNSAVGGVRCSGFQRRTPKETQYQQNFNSFRGSNFFMSPIDEDKEISASRTRKMEYLWRRIPNGVKPGVDRLLWPQIPSNLHINTPIRRFH